MKTCTRCGESKSLSEFYPRSDRSEAGVQPACKACTKARLAKWRLQNPEKRRLYKQRNYLKDRYGITREDRDRMIQEQGEVCAVCGDPLKAPCVDHDHKTGKVRAILCSGCNSGLGQFRESPERLQRAIEYLAKHSYPAPFSS